MAVVTLDTAITRIGIGRFQMRLLGIFGLVWAADAMQVISIGFAAPSIATSFGISMTEALQIGTAFFLGMMFGAWGFGRLADRYGRRRILIITVCLDAVFGLASAAAPDYWTLMALRFLTGAAVGGTLPVDYAMMAEFLPPARRGRWLVILEGFWAVGTVAVALTAWIAALYGAEEAWRWIFLINALPALIGFGLRFWIPESPYHLSRTGRTREAKAVLDRMAKVNRVPRIREMLATGAQPNPPARALFAGRLRRRSVLILTVWFLVSAAYYGVFVWLPGQLASEGHGFVRGYGFLVLVALAQIPGYALAAYGVERWGRRPTLIAFLIVSAIGCLLWVVVATPLLVAISTLLMSFALLGTWGALYAFTPEIYPTGLRASGMGMAGAMARLGGLLAPSAVAFVVAVSFDAAIGLFALLLLAAAVAARAIDVETRDRPLA